MPHLFRLATVNNDDPISLKRLLAEAENYVASYLERTAGLSHATKGIRRSEMFFLYAAIAHLEPKRILESGRARAQSTLVLSSLFPQATIVSIESEANSPDVAVAAARLKNRTNIECLFGDSRLLLPKLLREGDIILIDGPKDFRALKLALRLLRTGKPHAVWVHDLWFGLPARRFVDCHLRKAFLSDNPEFVRRYARLDSSHVPLALSLGHVRRAYGATLACFPAGSENYTLLLAKLSLAQGLERVRETMRKILRRPARARPKDD